MLKFDLAIKKKNKIQKLHLNFEIRLKQRSKFEFYFLFFEKIKIEQQIRFYGKFRWCDWSEECFGAEKIL